MLCEFQRVGATWIGRIFERANRDCGIDTEYYWRRILDEAQFQISQDRLFAYVGNSLMADVAKAGQLASFVEESDRFFIPRHTELQAALDMTTVQGDLRAARLRGHRTAIDYYKDLSGMDRRKRDPREPWHGTSTPAETNYVRFRPDSGSIEEFLRGIFDKETRRKAVAVAGAAMELGTRIGPH
jgi:hypothetical protein